MNLIILILTLYEYKYFYGVYNQVYWSTLFLDVFTDICITHLETKLFQNNQDYLLVGGK